MDDTWNGRDLPVLDAVFRARDEDPDEILSLGAIADLTGMTVEEVG